MTATASHPARAGAAATASPHPARHLPGSIAERHAGSPAEKGFLAYLGTALSAAVLMLVLGLAVITIVLPALVGGRPLTVLTQSMEPGLPPGTLLVIRPTPAQDVRVGDVLTYQIESGKPDVVSHRVTSKTLGTDGSVTFTTKGDNNDVEDPPVQAVQVVGTLWYSVPLLGWVNNVFNGDLRAKIVPFIVGALFLYAGWQVFTTLRDRRRKRRTGLDGEAGGMAP
jgi:signal peptidase I